MELSKYGSLTAEEGMPISSFGGSILMCPALWFLWCKVFLKDKCSNSSIFNTLIMQIMLKCLDCMILKHLVSFPARAYRVTLLTWLLHISLLVSDHSAHWVIPQPEYSFINDKIVFQCQASMNDILQKQCALIFITRAAWVLKYYLN